MAWCAGPLALFLGRRHARCRIGTDRRVRSGGICHDADVHRSRAAGLVETPLEYRTADRGRRTESRVDEKGLTAMG